MSGQAAAPAALSKFNHHYLQLNALAERFAGLVASVVRVYARGLRADEREDLRQAGFEGRCHAARRFSPTQGVSFPTFAYFYVRKMVLEERRRLRPSVPENFVHHEWAQEKDHWEVSKTEHQRRVEARHRAGAVDAFIGGLPPGHARVVEAVFYRGRTQAATARQLGVSRPRVNAVLRKVAIAGRTALQGVAF